MNMEDKDLEKLAEKEFPFPNTIGSSMTVCEALINSTKFNRIGFIAGWRAKELAQPAITDAELISKWTNMEKAFEAAQQQVNADGWKEAVDLLLELSQLKKYKDAIGKDDFYNKRQPELWKEVNDFLDKFKAQV